MRRPRIYTELALSRENEIVLEKGASHHLTHVLRLKPGAEIVLFNGDGHNYSASILEVERKQAIISLHEQGDKEPPGKLVIELGIGISKGERMDFAIQKAVELGVEKITPLITERCVVRLSKERMERRLGHWRNIIISACEQSGRTRLPELRTTENINSWIDTLEGKGIGLLLDHRSEKALNDLPTPGESPLHLLVGPEGGLSKAERELAKIKGLSGVRLGPRVLRTETAPLAAIAAMQMLWGDFRSD